MICAEINQVRATTWNGCFISVISAEINKMNLTTSNDWSSFVICAEINDPSFFFLHLSVVDGVNPPCLRNWLSCHHSTADCVQWTSMHFILESRYSPLFSIFLSTTISGTIFTTISSSRMSILDHKPTVFEREGLYINDNDVFCWNRKISLTPKTNISLEMELYSGAT